MLRKELKDLTIYRKMKKYIRLLIRKILGTREFETINDSLTRKKYNVMKLVNRKSFTTNDLENELKRLGLSKGDIVILHSSWRALIGYNGTPKELIDCILSIIGKDGTLLMPAFTNNKEVFNYSDSTSAGYLSEFFRTNYNVSRSLNNVFSMCAYGKMADKLTKSHIQSDYYFDSNSPYYKSMVNEAKILLIGLGKKPHKISLFHCISYELKDSVKCYSDVYTLSKNGIIIDKNRLKHTVTYIDRQPKFQNDTAKFKKLFQHFVNKNNYGKINKTDIYLFNSNEMFYKVKKYIKENNYNIYK